MAIQFMVRGTDALGSGSFKDTDPLHRTLENPRGFVHIHAGEEATVGNTTAILAAVDAGLLEVIAERPVEQRVNWNSRPAQTGKDKPAKPAKKGK